MEHVERIYLLCLAAVGTVLIIYRLVYAVSSWTMMSIPCFGNRSIRHILLSSLVYPRLPVKILGIDTLSPSRIILLVIFFGGTGVCNFIYIDNLSEASRRAAQISLTLLIPLFLSGGREFPARLLGISLETYGFIHRNIGLMSAIQASVHVAIVSRSIKFDTSNSIHFSGLVVRLI